MSNVFVTLGEKCRLMGGGTPSRKTPEFFQGNIPWVSVKDFKTSVLQDSEEHISELAISSSATHLIPAGTVLLVTRVGLGKVAIAGCDLTINQDVKAVFPSEDVLPEFLFWFLRSQAENIVRMGTGATVKGVTLEQVKAIKMPLLPKAKQSSIVDILSRAEGIVRLQQQALDHAKALIPALFVEIFGDPATNPKGWPVVTLGDILSACDYGSSSKAGDDTNGYPVLRMGNVTYAGELDDSNLKYIELDDAEYQKYALQTGDILFNRTNSKDLVGKTGLWDGRYPAIAASYFIRLRINFEQATPEYVWAYMNLPYMKRVMFETARGAIGQANINTKELKAFALPLPALNIQQEFTNRLTEAQSIITQQTDALTKSRELFDALLAQTFASESPE